MKRNFSSLFQQFTIATLMASAALAGDNAGHALAQKFAVEEKPAAAAPAKPQPKKVAETQPAAKRAPAPGQDYEREMLEAAKAEAAQRQTAEQNKAKAADTPAAAAAPAQKSSEAPSSPPAAATAPAAAEPSAKKAAPQVQIKVQANIPNVAPKPAGDRASLLVVLNQTGSGDIPKTFDPILCIGEVCYVSAGNDADARPVPRKDALSPKGSMTTGAGVCAGTPACAFRGISLPDGATAQIVDLGIVRHDHREPVTAKIDATCSVEDGFLACDKPITAPDYRIWVVPEAVAAQAGAEKIEAALDAELPEENVTLETDK